MRACRRFLAGIPHLRPGHPCVTHPSATPSLSEEKEDVRLACVRHAASVYPEPGSNSPSVVVYRAHQLDACGVNWLVVCYPTCVGVAIQAKLLLWLFHLHLAVRRFVLVGFPPIEASHKPHSFDRNCERCLRVSLQLLFCFPLFSCQGTNSKQALLAPLSPSRDR
jgi:hypothetical protein